MSSSRLSWDTFVYTFTSAFYSKCSLKAKVATEIQLRSVIHFILFSIVVKIKQQNKIHVSWSNIIFKNAVVS